MNANENNEATLLSIGFMMEKMEKILWRSGGGRGPWEACLAALVITFDPRCTPAKLLEALPADKDLDRVDLLNTMANLGYYATSTALRLKEVETRLLPCLFVSGEKPYVALRRDENGTLIVYDGTRHEIHTAEDIEGDAFFFMAYDKHRQQTSKFMREGTGKTWFGAVIARFSQNFRQILITCFALNLFALAPSLFVMAVYDRVISPADLGVLPALTIGVSLALVAEYFLRDVRSDALAWMTARLDNLIGGRIFPHLIGLSPDLIEQASVAAQVARIRTFESVRDFFSSAVFLSFLEIPFVIIAVAAMVAVAGPLAAVPLLMVGAYVALFFFMRAKIKVAIRLAAKASSARQQFTLETLEKLRHIRACGLSAVWHKKYEDLSGREILMSMRLGFLGTVAETLANALTILAAIFTVGFGAHLIWSGQITTGALVASMILVWRILLPFYSLCTMIPRIEQLRNSVQQVNALMDIDAETETEGSAVLQNMKGDVTLENVSLFYGDGADPVIIGLNLRLKPGSIYAVTGRNGAGKSSLLKMIKGLYRPQSGLLRLDGFDARQLDARALRRQISYVPQRAEFFPGTIAENLLIANPFATKEMVEEALKRADAWEDVQGLEKGMDTDVTRDLLPQLLSAKLSLARAYMTDAPILLIDELPNALLSGKAGDNLKQYLKEGKAKRTVVFVTYRGDMLDLADQIIRMARGEPVLAGLRDDILKRMKEAA